jgi:hypothetical protein
MYCKKCGINYKKDKKVCSRCGLALQPGEFKQDNAPRRRKIIIIACSAALVVIAFFAVIFFTGRVPPKLLGTWYEVNGYGYMEFKPRGVMTYYGSGNESSGTYAFNNETGEGTIVYHDEEDTLTCDGTTLSWGGSVMTKTYVEQVELDFGSIIDQMG